MNEKGVFKIKAYPWYEEYDDYKEMVCYGIDCPLCGKPAERFFGCETTKDRIIHCPFCKTQFKIINFKKFMKQVKNHLEEQRCEEIKLEIIK